MKHQPHLYLPATWDDRAVAVGDSTRSHLERVLRYPEGGTVTYTDGVGTFGVGRWVDGVVERGEESVVPVPQRRVTIAVAPPKAKERQRFIVEKLQELGVWEVAWVVTERTQARPPREDRALAWATAALEQSRGAYLVRITVRAIGSLDDPYLADVLGESASEVVWPDPVTILVGPEGGFTDLEIGNHSMRVSLGAKVLRTETAALVGAVWALG